MNKEELLAIVNKAEEEKRSLTEEEKALINQALETRAEEKQEPDEKEDDIPTSGETEETKACESPNNKEEERAEEDPQEPSKEEDKEPKKEEERNTNNKVIINNKMEKRFNLMKELRSSLETGKSFNLAEVRAYTVGDEGEDVVQTDIYDIWEPLRAKNVLVAAGARTITGIKNNVQIPVMSATQAYFASETGATTDGSGAFTAKKLSPKRITCKVPVSLNMLSQDSIGIENAIRADIQKAVNSKLEAVLLGEAAGTDDQPAGLFYPASSVTSISNFSGITDFEGTVEEANVDGGKYIISPKAKAALRNMAKSAKSTQLVMENGAIDGTEAFVTSHISGKKVLYGDFSNVVIATWDNVQVDVVRDVASVGNGVVTIVVNAFVDAALVREGAVVAGKITV